jgi:hypothetical protein
MHKRRKESKSITQTQNILDQNNTLSIDDLQLIFILLIATDKQIYSSLVICNE